jgi:uncharacterized protein
MNDPISRVIYLGANRSVGAEQVKRTLRPGEELVWQENALGERIGMIIRPPSGERGWIVFFYGNGMTVAQTWNIRQVLGRAGYGVVCVEYVGYGVSPGSPSEYGCYRSADAAIAYLRHERHTNSDQVALIGWSLGSAVAIDLASRRKVRAQVLLSPLTNLLATALDLARLGRAAPGIGPFNSLAKASAIDCPTLVVNGAKDALTRPWMADKLTKALGSHAQQVILPDVGHNDMLGTGDRLWNVVIDFLNS